MISTETVLFMHLRRNDKIFFQTHVLALAYPADLQYSVLPIPYSALNHPKKLTDTTSASHSSANY